MISRENFISAIESIREQMHFDSESANSLGGIFFGSTIFPYDNSRLIKSIISLLREWFPKDDNGFCEIEHYCFDMNFGKYQEEEIISPGDLYDRLISEDKAVSFPDCNNCSYNQRFDYD